MPHPKGWALPAPEHDQEFEVLCLELLAARRRPLVEPNLYGRSGQAQHGVDFVLQLADGLHAYQCKRVETFSFAEFEAEVAKTRTFPNRLESFTVLTTAPNDARVQDQVGALSATRVASGSCPVAIAYWTTIRDWLGENIAVARAHYPELVSDRGLAAPPRKPLAPADVTAVLDALALHERKRLSAAQVIGGLKAKGYLVEKMADVYALVAEHKAAQPASQPAPQASFADRLRQHASREQEQARADAEAAEVARRAQQMVEARYEVVLRELVATCTRVATEASALLGEGSSVAVEAQGDQQVLVKHGPYCICVRHHLEMFRERPPYAQLVITRRTGWRQNDAEQLGTPQLPLVAAGPDTLAWQHQGRRMSSQAVAEWVVEELLRLGARR